MVDLAAQKAFPERYQDPLSIAAQAAFGRMPSGYAFTRETATEYLMSSVTKNSGGCWIWDGKVNNSGYGTLSALGTQGSHRVSYMLFNGPVPDGVLVLHRCDVRRCCNPEHLFLGTHSENTQDMVNKGRRSKNSDVSLANWRRNNPEAYQTSILRGEENGRARFTEAQVREMWSLRGALSLNGIARKFGCSKAAVCHIFAGRCWAHIKAEQAQQCL